MSNSLRPFLRSLPVNQLRHEVDRVFNEFLTPARWEMERWLPMGGGFPRLNVWEENDVLFAEAEVPGLKVEDLDVNVVGNQLTVKGKRETSVEEAKEGSFHRRERGVGEFTRTVTLPVEIDADKVEASLVDGVLKVTLPKAEKAKPRKINITRS